MLSEWRLTCGRPQSRRKKQRHPPARNVIHLTYGRHARWYFSATQQCPHKGQQMRRRDFITLLGATAAPSSCWPLNARAQQPERMRRIGILLAAAADDA